MKAMWISFVLLIFFFIGFLDAQQLVDTQTVAGWKITETRGNIDSASTTIIDTVSQSFHVKLQNYDDSAYVVWGKKLDRLYSIPAYDQAHPYSEYTVIGWDQKYETSGPSTAAFFSQFYFGSTSSMYPLQPGFMDATSGYDWSSIQSSTNFYPNPTETMDSIALKVFTNGTYAKADFRGIKIFYAHEDSVGGARKLDSSVVVNVFGDKPTAIDVPRETPQDFTLSQNYPNPFNPSTKIQYVVSSMSYVVLKVYDILGREVATLANEEKSAGSYEVQFNASNLPSGTYFYVFRAGNYAETKKMVLLK